MAHNKISFKNIVENEENAGYQHFLRFPQCFLTIARRIAFLGMSNLCPAGSFTLYNFEFRRMNGYR